MLRRARSVEISELVGGHYSEAERQMLVAAPETARGERMVWLWTQGSGDQSDGEELATDAGREVDLVGHVVVLSRLG